MIKYKEMSVIELFEGDLVASDMPESFEYIDNYLRTLQKEASVKGLRIS
jgi:hypothetical protein